MNETRNLLSSDAFRAIVRDSILVSIDLVVTDGECVLLGKRRNRPAKDFYFVPGGRIFHGEPLDEAFARISLTELGQELPMSNSQFLGLYQHLWPDNFANDPSFGTHYIALAYGIKVSSPMFVSLPHDQHDRYDWLSYQEVGERKDVHPINSQYLTSLLRFASEECFSRSDVNALVHPPLPSQVPNQLTGSKPS